MPRDSDGDWTAPRSRRAPPGWETMWFPPPKADPSARTPVPAATSPPHLPAFAAPVLPPRPSDIPWNDDERALQMAPSAASNSLASTIAAMTRRAVTWIFGARIDGKSAAIPSGTEVITPLLRPVPPDSDPRDWRSLGVLETDAAWRERKNGPPIPGAFPQLRPLPKPRDRQDAPSPKKVTTGVRRSIRELPCPVCKHLLGSGGPLLFDDGLGGFAHRACLRR